MLEQKELITSRQNPTIKRICSLSEKKGRRAEGLFRFDGIKLFGEALEKGLDVKYVLLNDAAPQAIKDAVEKALQSGKISLLQLIVCSEDVFSKASEERSPEGIITVAALMPELHRALFEDEARGYGAPAAERLLIAESLRDPGNLGTVIRSCRALGIDRLIISDDCADIYSPKVIRAAMGGLFCLRIDMIPAATLSDAILSLREGGRAIYAAALRDDAKDIGALKLKRGDCFVIGNEGHGLSDAVIKACDACAIIPMREGSESLNAAAAATICIWESVKN
jgi:TrmH family RNA methyltransferase